MWMGRVVDLPDVEIENLNNIGPNFPTGSGAVEITIQGYLVKIREGDVARSGFRVR